MPEGEHAAILETYSYAEGVIQLRVTGSLAQVTAYARVMRERDPSHFCIRNAETNTCACSLYGVG